MVDPGSVTASDLKDLEELCTENALTAIFSVLSGSTLDSLEKALADDRVAFLASLKEKGVDKLSDRQKLANAIGKAKRLNRF